ncbi:MAG: prephenate dehydrogenase/arogenate dehydrogenase family protein [Candidatus Diapherotrites archaeon]|nr:prephenate dehydrogenase/arogenate dehydrogenase family protein [Candidatus Diapherotrites archaeon]
MEIGIIGFGRLGQLLAKHLAKRNTVFVNDRKNKKSLVRKLNVTQVSVQECAKKEMVLLCVPISQLEFVLQKCKNYFKAGSLIMDTCTVKQFPCAVMKKEIPKNCEIVGTHPLFGPDSAKTTLKNHSIVLCPVRIKKIKKVKLFFERLGLKVIIASPRKHDQDMARSVCLLHFLGKALKKLNLKKVQLSTPTHQDLIKLLSIVENDSNQLFQDMHVFNLFSKKIRQNLMNELRILDQTLNTKVIS